MAKHPTRERLTAPKTVAPNKQPTPPGDNSSIREKVEEAIGPVVGANQRGQVVERVVQLVAREVFSGPMPHPRHLEKYEEICPGLADRIMSMAETAQQRQENRRDTIIEKEYEDRRVGMYLGFAALIAMLTAGGVLSIYGFSIAGGGLITAAVLGAAVSPFVDGRRSLKDISWISQKRGQRSPGDAGSDPISKNQNSN